MVLLTDIVSLDIIKPDFSLTNTLIHKRSLVNQGGRQPSESLEYSAFGADLPTDKPPPIDTHSRQLVWGETNGPILTRSVKIFGGRESLPFSRSNGR